MTLESDKPVYDNPSFRNVKPRTRKERLALRDKALREKELLIKRPGLAAKIYRENVPETQAGLTSLKPDGAGYITDADRFHTDVSGEEFLRRKAMYRRGLSIIDKRRKEQEHREKQKWERMEAAKAAEEEYWQKQRKNGLKAKANQSMVPYNAITLLYNDGLDGDRLRYEDDRIRYRAALRARNIHAHGGSKYNIISGEDIKLPPLPSDPRPSPVLGDWLKSSHASRPSLPVTATAARPPGA